MSAHSISASREAGSNGAEPAGLSRQADNIKLLVRPVRSQLWLGMVLSAIATAARLGSLVVLALLLSALLAQPDVWPWTWLLWAMGLTVTSYVLRIFSFNQTHYAAFRLETVLRTQLTDRLGKVSMGYAQGQGAAALSKVIFEDVKALHIYVADSMPLYARAYVSPFMALGVLLWLDWRLALVSLAVLVGGFAILSAAMMKRSDSVKQYNDSREKLSAAVVEYVQAMPVVRVFDSGNSTFTRYQQALDEFSQLVAAWYRESGLSARLSMAILGPLPTLLAVTGMAIWLAQGEQNVTGWLGVMLLCTGLAEAFLPMMTLMHLVDRARISASRIQEVLQAPVMPPVQTAQVPHDASVRFESVTFRYDEEEAAVLENVSFYVPSGTVTALVGPSGAGKSTVARLIPRFWDVTHGRILIGGVDVRQMDSQQLMQQVAYVSQEAFLFADTVAANIALGSPGADAVAIAQAARAAQSHDFVMSLPQGYDTPVGERGVFLSGGQRQRIAIARAILQNRPILVLDEATAFADPENEAALIAALSVLMRGKTVIMIAHRLGTIRDVGQILVFDHGHLVQVGQHVPLSQEAGVYARLWQCYEAAQNWSLGKSTKR